MKLKTLVFGTAVLLGFSSYTLAYTVTIDGETSNVGWVDKQEASSHFHDWTYPGGSSEQGETAWVNDVLGTSFDSNSYEVDKTENVLATKVNENNAYGAFEFDVAPAYFLIKDGAGENDTHWLFKNEDSLNWGVVNLEELFGNSWNSYSYTISHVTQFGIGVPVPEPGTIALMTTGVIGLFAARRRTKKAA